MSFISEFLTVNSFLLKLDVGKFIGELCLVRSYHISAGRCEFEFENKLVRKSSRGESLVILENLIIEYNPIRILINIIELILQLIS